jgi:hypothetical protein
MGLVRAAEGEDTGIDYVAANRAHLCFVFPHCITHGVALLPLPSAMQRELDEFGISWHLHHGGRGHHKTEIQVTIHRAEAIRRGPKQGEGTLGPLPCHKIKL